MELSLVFNELSRLLAPDADCARRWMQTFAGVVKAAHERKITSLRIDEGFRNIELSAGYPIEKWYNDHLVDEPTREFIRDLAATLRLITPHYADLSAADVVRLSQDQFGMCHETRAVGLTFACLTDGLGISFLSDEERWDACEVTVVLYEAADDDADDLKNTSVQVRHAARVQHLDAHAAWIAKRLESSVGNGSDLLSRVKTWYPHLVFCRNARQQIEKLPRGAMLDWVMDSLNELEQYCRGWEEGGFDGNRFHKGSFESDGTLKQYGAKRQFRCPDDKTRLFSYHLKKGVDSFPKRIHIWADESAEFGRGHDHGRKILIGYVGDHLPTATDPT